MREGQKRINVYLPDNLYSSVLNSKYKDMTTAVIKGLEKLLEPHREDFEQVHTNTQENSNSLQNELILSLKNHIASLESQIHVKDEQLRTQAVHIQTVLTQKAIGTGYTPKEERKTAARKEAPGYSSVVQEYSTASKEEKGQIEKICKYCNQPFYTDNIQKEYCSKEHKDQAYNEKRRENRRKEKIEE